jgi:hypothetical protein
MPYVADSMPITSTLIWCDWSIRLVCARVTCENGNSVEAVIWSPFLNRMANTTFVGMKAGRIVRPLPRCLTFAAKRSLASGEKSRLWADTRP